MVGCLEDAFSCSRGFRDFRGMEIVSNHRRMKDQWMLRSRSTSGFGAPVAFPCNDEGKENCCHQVTSLLPSGSGSPRLLTVNKLLLEASYFFVLRRREVYRCNATPVYLPSLAVPCSLGSQIPNSNVCGTLL